MQKQHNIISLQHMVLHYYQERMAISVYSLNVMKYMENRITQWINSALYDKGTNRIRHVFVIKRVTSQSFNEILSYSKVANSG